MTKLSQKLKDLEAYVYALGGRLDKLLTSDFIKNWRVPYYDERLNGVYLGLCVNTKDPLRRNRVQFYSSVICGDETVQDNLPWANPISVISGFDDSGLSWIPPAGSTIVIVFPHGDRNTAFYLGTIHPVSRGQKPYQWGFEIQEYYDLWEGHRGGYLVGPDDESQVLPPWTSENYNAIDATQFETFDDDPDAFNKVTFPNIYGIKTPGKHRLKFVDGDHQCNDRWNRVEFSSGRGNILIFKDDDINPCGQWTNPSCGNPGPDLSVCDFTEGCQIAPKEDELNKGSNPYYKRIEECRPYIGAPTPQQNACALPQSGLQLQSLSGHQLVFDDSVEQPFGDKTNWEKEFSFGCTDKFLGKSFWKSATGHSITLNDQESDTEVRDDGNGIEILTAAGNRITMNDHSTGDANNCKAGDNRGIVIETTAQNTLEMVDAGNNQCSPVRTEGGEPEAKASGAYIRLRTGYGTEIKLDDSTSQEQTELQAFHVFVPDETTPDNFHFMRMQVSKPPESQSQGQESEEQTYVFLRSGGILLNMSNSHSIEVVGSEDEPASKLIDVSDQFIVASNNVYFTAEEDILLTSKGRTFIFSGQDCPSIDDPTVLEPCPAPVVVYLGGRLVLSDRIYGSASPNAQPVTLPMVMGG